MTGNLQPLDQKFPIVDAQGRPTLYFIKWAQQKQIDIGAGITAEQALQIIEQYLADHTLQAGSGIAITPSGNLSDSPTVAAEVQAILDQITNVHGSILFRGAAGWQALAPGTSGNFLKTNGAGADPSWATGGGGGGADLGPAWVDLTFGSSSSIYGTTAFVAGESFTLAAGQKLEIEAYIYKTINTTAAVWVGNGTNAHNIVAQSDNNIVLYRRSGGTNTSIGALGANTFRDFTGMFRLDIFLNCSAASSNFVQGLGNTFPVAQTAASTAFSTVDTLTPALETGDISKCYARARVVG